jgi:PAS domain S-box-containing protein
MAGGREVQQDVQLGERFYIVWIVPFPEERYANVYGRDITERKQAEEALRESEARLNRAQEIAHLGSWELDLVNSRLTWSDEVYRIFGLQPQEFGATYETFLEAVHPDDRAAVDAAYSASVREGKDTYEIEHRVVRKSTGEIRVVHERCAHIRDASRQIIRSIGMVHDITERKRAEETVRERTLELQQLTATLEQRVQERTEELEEANKALRNLSTRLLSAQEEERKRVAGELHDTIGACLSGIKFKVESSLQQMGKTQNHMTESLKTIIPVIQEGIEDCRRMQQDLRPSMLDDLGLLPTLSWFCRRYQTIYTGIKVELEQTLEEREIPNSLKIVIYRVTQEGMNNIAKHSKADLVRLFLRKMDGRIELILEDNGQGFDLKKVLASESTRRGLGLTSMRERIELSGGSFAIESAEGKGTTIRATWTI